MFICFVQICYNNFDNKYSRVFLLSIHQSVMCLVGFWLMTESYKKSEVKTQKWIYVGHISRHMSDIYPDICRTYIQTYVGQSLFGVSLQINKTATPPTYMFRLEVTSTAHFVHPSFVRSSLRLMSKCLPFIGALVIVYTQT